MLSGPNRSVSLVPGAPPRCETPPMAPSPSTSTTVQPVGRSIRVWWPTLRPATVVRPARDGLDDAGGLCPAGAMAPRPKARAESAVAKARDMTCLLVDVLEGLRQPARHRG